MAAYAAAIAAVAGAVESSNKRKQAQAEIQNRIDAVNAQERARQTAIGSALGGDFLGQFGLDDIFGTKPAGIDPISVNTGLSRNINQIRNQGLPAALEFTSDINQQFSDESLRLNLERINNLIPNFGTISGQIGNVTEDLLFGRLPFDDVLDIVSDRQSLAGSLGIPGGAEDATLRDLGLSRMEAISTGANMFTQFADTLARSVSPIPQFARGDELLPFTSLTADQRVMRELQTTEALQRAELIRSQADPAAAALFGEEFFFQQTAASTRAGTRVPNTIGGDAFVAGASAFDVERFQEQQAARNQPSSTGGGATAG
jgi:hypothetical protein